MTAKRQEAPAPTGAPVDGETLEIMALTDGLVGRVWVQFQARVAEFSLSVPEAKALQLLEQERPLSMRELAARLHANPSNVTVAVARLEARGLVSRETAADRRVRGVRLTPAGALLRERLSARLAEDHPAASLPRPQREALLEILRRIDQRS